MNQNLDFDSLKEEIEAKPNEFDPKKCIQFLQTHEDAVEKMGNYLFDIESNFYALNQIKEKIFKEICISLPSLIGSIILPYFQLPNSISIKNSYRLYRCNILIERSFIDNSHHTYEQLGTIINTITNKTMYKNISLKYFLIKTPKVQPFIKTELNEIIKSFINHINNIIDQFLKPIYVPSVIHCDSSNPRISKFGGIAPYLPTEGPIVCNCGADKLQTIFSLYVPSLPEEIQNLFPKNHEFVVVGYACNSCYEELKVNLYCDDQLVYDDVPDNDNVFNDPRKVVDWALNFMHPNGLEDSGFELPNKDSYDEEELFFIDEFLRESNDGKPETYLGGYPIFIQGDDSPPGYKLLLEMAEGEASTNMWGDCGTCQVWMSVDDDFGDFIMQYNCS